MRAALILMPLVTLAGCNMAGGHGRDADRDHRVEQRAIQVAGNFDRVSLAGSPDVVVTVGGAPSVRAEGDAELLDRLEIVVKDGTLSIGYKQGGSWSWDMGRHRGHVTVYVTAPTLAGAAIGGSGDMRIDKVEGNAFAGAIGGSGDMAIGAMKVGNATFSIAGSGDIQAAGTAQQAKLSVAGSGDIDAVGLQSRAATVAVVGSGDVRVRASDTADVSIMGSGDVEIVGGAKCNIHKMGSGDVRCSA
ncbi:MAG TPA: head GIN domain-containing protein [Allosphingosinicella sp.]|jgi:hypothetical protein